MFYKEIKEQARPGSAFLEHLETQGLKISAHHNGRKGEGELQDVTGLPKKTLDTSLLIARCVILCLIPAIPGKKSAPKITHSLHILHVASVF